jgi:DNA-binding NarL/FixJ family response regulator
MKKAVPKSNECFYPLQNAFLIYRPKSSNKNDGVFYNQEASQILSRSLQSTGKNKFSHAELCSLCSQWKQLLEENMTKTEEKNMSAYFLDTLKSDRRLYGIKGLRLSNHHSSIENQFLFIMERIQAESINLSLISRQCKLNQREQDIVRLLIEDKGNKEIAQVLGLSLNTIKSYLKILMRKLGVSSRAGVITCLLMKK